MSDSHAYKVAVPFKGCGVVSFNFIEFLKVYSVSNSTEADQMPRFAASDLVLHCLPMPPKSTLGLSSMG